MKRSHFCAFILATAITFALVPLTYQELLSLPQSGALAAPMPRIGRSGDSRLVTCLEATEMGFAFVTTCSKCDYYLQNRALNLKAQKCQRSELSKMWQCTAVHKVGDLFSSQSQETPYRPTNISKLNSFICTNRSLSRSTSTMKGK